MPFHANIEIIYDVQFSRQFSGLFTDAAHAEEVHLRSQYPVCFSENNQRSEKQHLSIIAPSAWPNRKFIQIEVLLDYFAWTFWTKRTTFETSWPQIVISCPNLLLYPADFDKLLLLGVDLVSLHRRLVPAILCFSGIPLDTWIEVDRGVWLLKIV